MDSESSSNKRRAISSGDGGCDIPHPFAVACEEDGTMASEAEQLGTGESVVTEASSCEVASTAVKIQLTSAESLSSLTDDSKNYISTPRTQACWILNICYVLCQFGLVWKQKIQFLAFYSPESHFCAVFSPAELNRLGLNRESSLYSRGFSTWWIACLVVWISGIPMCCTRAVTFSVSEDMLFNILTLKQEK